MPDPPKEHKGEPDRRSRQQRFKDDGVEVQLPEADAMHMVDYLWDVGPVASGGMGPAPISHAEISCWQENTGVQLSAWEARTLRALSREYVGELAAAEKPDRQAPYEAGVPTRSAFHTAKNMRAAIAGLASL